jgi:hypothetical protein
VTTPAPFVVSYHDDDGMTVEADFVFGASARAIFESLKSVPTVADAQLWADGKMVEDWKR